MPVPALALQIPVVDFDLAFVQPFDPAITIEKTAAPTELGVNGGLVTPAYQVSNTGDVPLADVTGRITDHARSPVSDVSGDEDGDGLLDTPTSISEDALDETWLFTCTTLVTSTAANTVVVTGSPAGPGGNPLSGRTARAASRRATRSPRTTRSSTWPALRRLRHPVPRRPVPPCPAHPARPHDARSHDARSTPPDFGGSLPVTGASGLGTMLTTGAIASMLGSLLVAVARRRQFR